MTGPGAPDLERGALAQAVPGRPLRFYPALLSTGADALAWARAGAAEGSIVAADYQASPRGRAGVQWHVRPGCDLCFSLVLRPRLSAEREGWLYTVAVSGVADALGAGTTIHWPDEVHRDGTRAGAVGVEAELGPGGTEWAVVNVLVTNATPPRGALLARVVEALEARYRAHPEEVLADYVPRCATLGRLVRARMIPLGPAGVEIAGTAVDLRSDGALVIETAQGSRVAARPQHLGVIE